MKIYYFILFASLTTFINVISLSPMTSPVRRGGGGEKLFPFINTTLSPLTLTHAQSIFRRQCFSIVCVLLDIQRKA